MDWDTKEAELRAGGWSDSEVRDYRKGWESAAEAAARPMPRPRPEGAPRVSVRDVAPVSGGRNRDYEAWRLTAAGRLHSLAYPDPAEAYAEHQETVGPEAVRQLLDAREMTYGTRPGVNAAREVLHHRGWERGQGFTGTAAGLQEATRWAFPDFVIRDRGEELPGAQQVSHPYPATPQGLAAMSADANAVRR